MIAQSPTAPLQRQLPKVYLRERLYLHRSLLTDRVRWRFTSVIPNYYPEFNEQGEYNEVRDLVIPGWSHVQGDWFAINRGHLDAVWDEFSGHCEIVDQRAAPRLSFPLRWAGVLMKDGTRSNLRPSQVPFIQDLMSKGYGIGEAPPRFGKTICMSAITCQAGLRTLIIVHQLELAKQFLQKFRRCTNIDALEARSGRRLAGLGRTWEDFYNLEICVTTWQRFHAVLPKVNDDGEMANEYIDPELLRLQREKLHKQQILRYTETQKHIHNLRNRFGLVMVDEAHRASSPCFSNVVEQFNAWYRFGVTATPERKDGLDAVIKMIVGPCVAEGDEEKVPLHIKHVYTGFSPKFKSWTAYENAIARDPRRNKLAVDLIERDVKDGHYVVVVTTRTEHIMSIVEALRARGISAAPFHGQLKESEREQNMNDTVEGKIRVLVAMRSMLLGIDVPLWSAMHILMPSANAPNYYQEIARVRTVTETKKFAKIRDYLDAVSASSGSYRTRYSVYTHPKKAPIFFEDEEGKIIERMSLAKILTKAGNVRQAGSKAAREDLEACQVGFGMGGISGVRVPKFDAAAGWGGLANAFQPGF